VDVLVVDPRDVLAVEDRRLLLDRAAVLRGRALLVATLRHELLSVALERLFAVVVVAVRVRSARGTAADRRGTGAATPAPSVARAAALDAVDFRGREPEARGDVVGDDLHDRPLLALVVLPAALLEPAAHDDARALAQRRADVLRQLPPRDHVEEAGLLL